MAETSNSVALLEVFGNFASNLFNNTSIIAANLCFGFS
jgi:hypothetical protein